MYVKTIRYSIGETTTVFLQEPTGVEKQQYGYKKLKAVWNCTVKIRENFWAGILLTWEEGRSYMMKTSEGQKCRYTEIGGTHPYICIL